MTLSRTPEALPVLCRRLWTGHGADAVTVERASREALRLGAGSDAHSRAAARDALGAVLHGVRHGALDARVPSLDDRLRETFGDAVRLLCAAGERAEAYRVHAAYAAMGLVCLPRAHATLLSAFARGRDAELERVACGGCPPVFGGPVPGSAVVGLVAHLQSGLVDALARAGESVMARPTAYRLVRFYGAHRAHLHAVATWRRHLYEDGTPLPQDVAEVLATACKHAQVEVCGRGGRPYAGNYSEFLVSSL